VGTANDRHPVIDAEDVHGHRARLIIPLIDPLRQLSLPRLQKERGDSPKKKFDTQRERHLQPLVDGIGASERETFCN